MNPWWAREKRINCSTSKIAIFKEKGRHLFWAFKWNQLPLAQGGRRLFWFVGNNSFDDQSGQAFFPGPVRPLF